MKLNACKCAGVDLLLFVCTVSQLDATCNLFKLQTASQPTTKTTTNLPVVVSLVTLSHQFCL